MSSLPLSAQRGNKAAMRAYIALERFQIEQGRRRFHQDRYEPPLPAAEYAAEYDRLLAAVREFDAEYEPVSAEEWYQIRCRENHHVPMTAEQRKAFEDMYFGIKTGN